MHAKAQGYQLHDGAIPIMIDGWNMAAKAWADLDKALFKKDGEIMGAPASLVNQQLAGTHSDPSLNLSNNTDQQ